MHEDFDTEGSIPPGVAAGVPDTPDYGRCGRPLQSSEGSDWLQTFTEHGISPRAVRQFRDSSARNRAKYSGSLLLKLPYGQRLGAFPDLDCIKPNAQEKVRHE